MIDTDDIAGLSADEKRILLSRLLMEQAGMSASVHPMSFGQRSMWFLHKLAPGSPAYTITFAGRIRGELNVAALERAAQALVDRHPVLRTTYGVREGEPVQLVHPGWPVHINREDFGDGEGVEEVLHREAHRPFDLETGPVLRFTLLRRSAHEHVLVLSVHHIAVDFWAIDVMLDELCLLYAAELGGERPAPPRGNYLDFVDRQRRMVASGVGESHWEYWRERLTGDIPVLQLPTDRPSRTLQSYRGAVHRFRLDRDCTARVKSSAKRAGVTPYVAVLTAYAALLHRYSGQDAVHIGSPFACRDDGALEDVVGYVANPVVLRIEMCDDPPFTAMLGRVKETVLSALAHQEFPFPLLVERLAPTRDPGHSPVFQTSFAWEQARRFDNVLGGVGKSSAVLDIETLHIGQGGAPLELTLMAGESDGGLSFAMQYNTDLFDASTIERMGDHLLTLLEGVAAHPDMRLSELPLLTARERRDQREWNDTTRTFDGPPCLHDLVARTVQRIPDAVAVTYGDESLTYRELDRQAAEVAQHLRALGVEPDTVVPVLLERSLDLIVALLGVLKAGGAFMPLDPAQPANRTAALIAELPDAAPCVTMQRHLEHLSGFTGPRLCLDVPHPARDGGPVCADTGAEHLAYVIHTSGSTGVPKAALNTHGGIRNRLLWMQDTYRLTAEDRVLHKTPVTFDASVLEIFWPLIAGARLVVAAPDGHKDNGYLVRTVVEQRVTTLFFVPSLLRSFLAEPTVAECVELRRVFSAGEVLPQDLAVRFFSTFDAQLWNEYGPAEASVGVTYYDCRRGCGVSTVPIGRPIANTRIHILDAAMTPVPVGVPGEMFIGGAAVGRGYLNRADATAAAFVTDPFADREGEKLYRTGDLARYNADGDIEYLGRRDDQVKIRGVRIEPGEIEAALNQHPAVGENAVVAVDDGRGNRMLAAYFTPTAPGDPPTTTDLRRFLHARLPAAMLPAVFRPTEALPRTSSGKIDRKALSAPTTDLSAPEQTPYVAPRTPTERILAEIWSEVLGHDRIGVHDDFFALGGSSSHSLDVAARAQRAGVPLTPESVFLCGTVAELAEAYPGNVAAAEGCGGPAPDPGATAPHTVEHVVATGGVGHDVDRRNTVIESLGTYLPPTVVSTGAVLDDCANPIGIPLERLTGIRTRRTAGRGEYAIDLARQAATDCLMHSSYVPEEIDLLLCCNVSRCDGPGQKFVFEPSTAARLRDLCGLVNATAFDISNACAGMFTGITVAEAFLDTGRVHTAMVVSGEYITQLTETAQKEISGPMDPRLACLTLGDAGAAVILERGSDRRTGFHDIDLATLGRYSTLCVGRATDQPHGGAIMICDSISGTAVAVKRTVPFVADVMRRHGWRPEHCDHIIMHQTSEASIHDGVSAINKLFGEVVAHPGNTIVNLAERGNTASTTHFVAVKDHILANRIKSGDNVVFGITGSGQTVGAALYTFDDLPDRLRRTPDRRPRRSVASAAGRPPAGRTSTRVRIDGVGICDPGTVSSPSAIQMAATAAAECLAESGVERTAIDLMIHAGVYREDFISEPAIAAFVAGELGINDDAQSPDAPTTLAFDVLNGGVGFLAACQVAVRMLEAKRAHHAIVMASEVETNGPDSGHPAYGVAELGSAVLLSETADNACGFGDFAFAHFPEYSGTLETFSRHTDGRTWLQVDRDPDLTAHYLDAVPTVVAQLLKSEELHCDDIAVVFAPFLSVAARAELGYRIKIDPSRFVELRCAADPFTSSFPLGLREARRGGLVAPGDVGLIISVGSGVEVGCATYHF